MRIWFMPVEREPNRSKIISGHVECHIRLKGQEKDIVFYTSCEDEGVQEVMTNLLNRELRRAVEFGGLVASSFAEPIGGQDGEDEPDCPQGTESERVARDGLDELDQDPDEGPDSPEERTGSHWPLRGDNPVQDTQGEEVEKVGEETEEDSETQEEGQDEEAPIGTGEGAVTG